MQFIGPIFIISIVIGIFVFISFLLSKKNQVLAYGPSVFLFIVTVLLFFNAYFGSTAAFEDVISVILGVFFGVCFVVTVISTFFFNRSNKQKSTPK
jgi:Ca2+/Na+ antiporter